jgi:alkylation response protein AidB-like acyl-CoA dehydrogenase
LKDAGESFLEEAAIAKLFASRAAHNNASQAIDL